VKNEELHRVKGENNTSHRVKRREAKWIGHIVCRKSLKETYEGREYEAEDLGSYWTTLRKAEDNEI
jgi:hypothetical protein